MSLRLSLVLSIIVGIASTAAGQRVITLNPVNVVGEVVQIGPQRVVVKAGDGRNWTVSLDNNTVVKIKGTAVPEMLTSRAYVRFVASIDKRTCKAQDKLDKITIFTPTQGIASRTPGVEFAKDAPADDEDDAAGGPARGPGMRMGQRPMPGQGPNQKLAAGAGPNAAAPADDEPPLDAKPKRGSRTGKASAPTVPDVASYEVCAQVVSYHNHRLTVNVQNRFMKPRITADLSPDAEIGLDLSDLSTVKPGDKVSARGYYVMPGVCQLTKSLTITLANPLGEKAGRSRRPPPATKTADTARRPAGKSKPEAAAGAPNPAADEEPPPAAKRPAAKEDPREKDEAPVMDDPNEKPQPAPKLDEKPSSKKPDNSAEKKPPARGGLKDVFEK